METEGVGRARGGVGVEGQYPVAGNDVADIEDCL